MAPIELTQSEAKVLLAVPETSGETAPSIIVVLRIMPGEFERITESLVQKHLVDIKGDILELTELGRKARSLVAAESSGTFTDVILFPVKVLTWPFVQLFSLFSEEEPRVNIIPDDDSLATNEPGNPMPAQHGETATKET